jgi:hypothetical protein
MLRSRSLSALALVSICLVLAAGCNKKNGTLNETVLRTPYSLYAGDSSGAIFAINSTNDGQLIFPTDGFATRSIITGGNNILFAKGNVFYSKDNGKNFDLSNIRINNFYLGFPIYFPWQHVMINPFGHDRVYLCSLDGKGILMSEDNGATWVLDQNWATGAVGGNITSFTQLKNGQLFAHNIQTDSLYRRDNKDAAWQHIAPVQGLPGSGAFFIAHINNQLTATDITGQNGVYYSNDGGVNWSAYTGLPSRFLYCTVAPQEQRLLVGTDSMGVYRLEGNTFISSNNGLDNNTKVYAIVGKEDVYKNETKRNYIYIATNKGLYRSEDGGLNWTKFRSGGFVTVY